MKSINYFRPYLVLTLWTAAFIFNSTLVLAQSTGGCDNYTPTQGQTVTCTSTSPAATAGVNSSANASNNSVTVNVGLGTVIKISGSPIGLGSNAIVNNSGTLNSNSFQNGYGISAGANNRSQAGGNRIYNLYDAGTSTRAAIVTAGTGAAGIYVSATNATSSANIIQNAGSISTSGANASGIKLVSGSTSSSILNTITNSDTGVISTTGSGSHGIQVSGLGAVSIENIGSITASGPNAFGIYSTGNITSLTNAQGGSSPLTFSGVLPTNYNTVISSPTVYGKLDASNVVVTGVMNFGISGSSAVSATSYSTVLSGIKVNNLGNSYGTITVSGMQYQWALVHRVNGSADQADLVVSAVVQPTLAALEQTLAAQSYLIAPIYYDTQTALASLGNALQGLFAMQSAGVINGMSYDCPLFGNSNICVSAGGRFTNVSAFPNNNSSTLMIGAYRASNNIRFGGYLDQNLSLSTPGGIAQLNNGSPMVGAFGVWSQNAGGTGLEAKLSAGYANKGATLTRPVVGVSEAGSGSTSLTSQGVLGVLKYGFGIGNKTILSPYAGMRYVVGGMGGYSEGRSSTVSSPLTYNAIDNYTATALVGFMGSHKLSDKTSLLASAGVEKDTSANVGNLITSGVGDFNLAMNNNYRSLRPTASLGAFHDLSMNERIGISAIYRQEAYQALTSTTVMATYTVGL